MSADTPRRVRPKLMMIALATSFVIGGAASAALQTVVVFQEGRKFSESEVTIRRGQSVTFTNHDPFAHNVFSQTPGMSFDLRTQKPGSSSEVQFDNVGEADVRCAIHPQMRMRVKVIP